MARPGTLLLCLLAATLAAAEEGSAPLSDAKRQLQQLQKDQATPSASQPGAELKGLMPGISAPGASGVELPPPANPAGDAEKRGPGQKSANWLVEGYDKLGTEAANAKGARSRHARGEADTREGRDEGLLGASAQAVRDRSDKTQLQNGAVRTIKPLDPMEPFMKVWLANSPVKDAILSARESSKRQDYALGLAGDDTADLTEGGQTAHSSGNNSGTADAALPGAAKAENPYLQSLNAPLPVAATAASRPAATAATPISPRMEAPPLDANAAGAAKSNAYNGPPSPAKDDKKYFPQLKRF